MLTTANLESKNSGNPDRFTRDDFEMKQDRMIEHALRVYHGELTRPTSIDLGLHSESRAKLRKLCQTAVLVASKTARRKYSYSVLSSNQSKDNDKNAISALRQLQKERLIVSRLGFAERAMELDKEIEVMRSKAKIARELEENSILDQRMKLLKISHQRKHQRLEYMLANETTELEKVLAEELKKMKKRQEEEFLRVLESATRRAVGRAKRCNCLQPYVCRHNKTASYNTRRPTIVVVQYRRNGKRLKHNGRIEEGQAWEEKAKEIDEKHQENWRERIANSIVASPWGANEAIVDQITETHKKELTTLFKTQQFKRDQHNKRQAMRRRNFANTIMAEERKVRMQCRKQALLRVIKDFAKEVDEEKKQKNLGFKSDGLKNVSKNLLGFGFDDEERTKVDWVPPTSFGLDNSVRLVDALKEVEDVDPNARILTNRNEMKKMTAEQMQDRVQKQFDVNDDEEEDDQLVESNSSNSESAYELGKTSGSKLLDKMRKRVNKQQELLNINNPSNNFNSIPVKPSIYNDKQSNYLEESPAKSIASTVLGGYVAPSIPNTPAPTFQSPRTNKLASSYNTNAAPTNNYQFPGSSTSLPNNSYTYPGGSISSPGLNAPSAPYSFPGSTALVSSLTPASASYQLPGSTSNTLTVAASSTYQLPGSDSALSTNLLSTPYQFPGASSGSSTKPADLSNNNGLPTAPSAPYQFPGTNNRTASVTSSYQFPGSSSSISTSAAPTISPNNTNATITTSFPASNTYQFLGQSNSNALPMSSGNNTSSLSASSSYQFPGQSSNTLSTGTSAAPTAPYQFPGSNNTINPPASLPYQFPGASTTLSTNLSTNNNQFLGNSLELPVSKPLDSSITPTVPPYQFPGSSSNPVGLSSTYQFQNTNTSNLHSSNAYQLPGTGITANPLPAAMNINEGANSKTIPHASEYQFPGYTNNSIRASISTSYQFPVSNSSTTSNHQPSTSSLSNNNISNEAISAISGKPKAIVKSPDETPEITQEYLDKQQNWTLDELDKISPKFKPGSVKDSDYIELENQLGYGYYTSYGIPIPVDDTHPDEDDIESHIGRPRSASITSTATNVTVQSTNKHVDSTTSNVATTISKESTTLPSLSNDIYVTNRTTNTMTNNDLFTPNTNISTTLSTPSKQSYQRYDPPAPGSAESIPKKSILISSTSTTNRKVNNNAPPRRPSFTMNYPMPSGSHIQTSTNNANSNNNCKKVLFGADEIELFKDVVTPPPELADGDTAEDESLNITTGFSLLELQKDSPVRSPASIDHEDDSDDSLDKNTTSNTSNNVTNGINNKIKSSTTTFNFPSSLDTSSHGYRFPTINNVNSSPTNKNVENNLSSSFINTTNSLTSSTTNNLSSNMANNPSNSFTNNLSSSFSNNLTNSFTNNLNSNLPNVLNSNPNSNITNSIANSTITNGFTNNLLNNLSNGTTNNSNSNITNGNITNNFTNNLSTSLANSIPSNAMNGNFLNNNPSIQSPYQTTYPPSTSLFTNQSISLNTINQPSHSFMNNSYSSQNNISAYPATSTVPETNSNNPSIDTNVPNRLTNNLTNQPTMSLDTQTLNQSYSPAFHLSSPMGNSVATSVDMSYLHVPPGSSTGGFYRPAGNDNDDEGDNSNENEPYDWSLTFFRLKCLENPYKSLDKLFDNDELYELAEIYASTLQSKDVLDANTDGNKADDENDEDDNEEDEDEEEENEEYLDGNQSIVVTLQLLYYYKKYKQLIKSQPNYVSNYQTRQHIVNSLDDIIITNLLTNINEILHLNLTIKELNRVTDYEDEIQSLLQSFSLIFVPKFILSNDFKVFYRMSVVDKQKILLDSQTFLPKFQKCIQKYKFAMHLYSTNRSSRPFANDLMRRLFGPMCDTPSPKEYVDSSTDPTAMNELLDAFKEGRDAMVGVVCRTLRGGKPPSLLCVKSLKSHNNEHLYTLVIFLDMSVETSEKELKKLNNILKAFP